jgi:ferric-dicitrate binding protein FerR (iron transport regulator)
MNTQPIFDVHENFNRSLGQARISRGEPAEGKAPLEVVRGNARTIGLVAGGAIAAWLLWRVSKMIRKDASQGEPERFSETA